MVACRFENGQNSVFTNFREHVKYGSVFCLIHLTSSVRLLLKYIICKNRIQIYLYFTDIDVEMYTLILRVKEPHKIPEP